MKLAEYLQSLNKHDIVAIGPASGSSYVYIGEAGDVETITNIFQDMIHRSEMMIRTYEHRIKVSCIRSEYELKKDAERIRWHSEYIRTAKPFLEREVNRTFHRETDDCTAVIIEGIETGQWWFKSEFDKANQFAKFTRGIMREEIAHS